ncbi:SatD family (SatD) [Blastococcus aggregatus]|uniref:SatD family (SatD) n=1 Tax=Blastococcus aggregatus TaxID=38502 RepID=A0A285V6K5_9ACTN|nr:SatD family protein [Blastococcus aggregatus]SOC49689.1 SatD family (SatD) [Blastococcus aggregatus]
MTTHVFTVLGDLVASKSHERRGEVQDRVVAALSEVDGMLPGVQPLEVTIGDEFQGAYGTLADAVRASLLIRLTLLPEVDSRFGIGSGPVTVFDADRRPISQDGPAWWAAREAIDHVHRYQQRSAHARGVRTWFVPGPPGGGEDASVAQRFVNAHLLCRDALVPRDDARAVALLRGWVLGRTQVELAEEAGISQSAVSQRLARMGAFAVRDAAELLAGEPA